MDIRKSVLFSIWVHSQTTFTAMEAGGGHEMSTLLNKFGKFYYGKLSTGGGGGVKKVKNL